MLRLLQGFDRVRTNEAVYGPGGVMEKRLAGGPRPQVCVIGCSDPCANPAFVFDASDGSLLSDTAPGAIIPAYGEDGWTRADATAKLAIDLGAEAIIVMSHSDCKAVEALAKGAGSAEIKRWTAQANGAFSAAQQTKIGRRENVFDQKAVLRETERQVALQSMENLKTYPCVRDALAAGKIALRAWWFHMEEGQIYEYDPAHGVFVQITADAPEFVHGCDRDQA